MNRSDLSALVREGGDRVEEHASLGSRTTYRVGGRARVLVTLKSVADLVELGPLMLASGLAVVCVGNGSNLLVADGSLFPQSSGVNPMLTIMAMARRVASFHAA